MTFAESDTEGALGRARLDSTQVSSSTFEGGGRDAAPAGELSRAARLRARLRESVWAPVLLKVLGIGSGMLALSAVGAVSILSPLPGFDLSRADPGLQKDIAGAWLASKDVPKPPPSASAATAGPAAPAAHEEKSPERPDSDAGIAKSSSGITADGKVILNLASADELTRLPGVGAKRAQRIVDLRNKLGRFRKLTDLLRVRGIGAKGLRRMLPHLVLDPPTGSS